MQEMIDRALTEGQGMMRDTSLFLHRDATVDISRFKIVKALFPHTAGVYAGPEQ